MICPNSLEETLTPLRQILSSRLLSLVEFNRPESEPHPKATTPNVTHLISHAHNMGEQLRPDEGIHFVVIGAGLAGLGAALSTKLANPAHRVTVLEAARELQEVGVSGDPFFGFSRHRVQAPHDGPSI